MKKKTCLALCLVLLLLASACGGGGNATAPSGGNSPAASAPGASVRTIAIARTSESSLRFIVFIKSILS